MQLQQTIPLLERGQQIEHDLTVEIIVSKKISNVQGKAVGPDGPQ